MELSEVIKARRSVRYFLDGEVTKEQIEDILYHGTLAPSAKNKQPWQFVVLRGESKDKVADMMIAYDADETNAEEKAAIGYFNSITPTAEVIKNAPVLIIIFREKDDIWTVGDNLSIGACVENMLLRAVDLGLATVWIRDICYVAGQVAEMVGHGDLELNCAVSLGVPGQFPPQRPRNAVDAITEWFD